MLLFFLFPIEVWSDPGENTESVPPAKVVVSRVEEKEVESKVILLGSAEPWLETVVAAESGGLVRKMLVDEGDFVKEGQLLCLQDSALLSARIKAAQASLEESRVLLRQANREFDRQKKLFKTRSVAEKAYEDAKYQADAVNKRRARLEAELLELNEQLKKKSVKAPVTGFIVKRHSQIGEWLGEGESVVTLVVLDPIRLIIPVPERYINYVKEGDESEINFDGLPDMSFKGSVAAVIPRGDEASRTFPVRIHIPNPDGFIKAGMLGRAVLSVGNSQQALLVPKDSLVLSSSGTSVYVIRDNTAISVNIEMGMPRDSLIEVRGALKLGEPVVIRGNERLRPGQRVSVIEGLHPEKTVVEDTTHDTS